MAQMRPAWLLGAAWFVAAIAVARASAKLVPRGAWRCSPTLASQSLV
jgi:hypothetical protein